MGHSIYTSVTIILVLFCMENLWILLSGKFRSVLHDRSACYRERISTHGKRWVLYNLDNTREPTSYPFFANDLGQCARHVTIKLLL